MRGMTVTNGPYRGTIQCYTTSLIKHLFHDSYTVTFVGQPSFDSLGTSEDEWINKPNAKTNVESMIQPRVK